MTNLQQLALRIEGAEPDRLLDANIHWRLHRDDFGADDDATDESYCYARGGWTLNRADHGFLHDIGVPRYTTSIDAALSLVPEGWRVRVDRNVGGKGAAWVWRPGDTPTMWTDLCATPALAIAAAALRAIDKENCDGN